MHASVGYLLALSAALFYTVAALVMKRALSLGAGVMRIVFISNCLTIPFFIPVIWIHPEVNDWNYLWAALLAGLLNFLGMILTFVTIRLGDISIQTPLMGTKIIMVGALSVWLGAGDVPLTLWIGALLSLMAVYTMRPSSSASHSNQRQLWLTVGCALATALAFALCDVCMAKYAPLFGEGPLLFISTLLTGILSLTLIPFFEGPLKAIPPVAMPWVWMGSILMGLEVLTFCVALGFYGNATAINILYSSRGLWSVVLVWFCGSLFANDERLQGKKVMFKRLFGACLLLLAIILVMTQSS